MFRTDALILMFTLNFRYYFYVKNFLILFLLFSSISFKANSIQLSETNEFDTLLVNAVLKCSNDFKKDLFFYEDEIYTFKRIGNNPIDMPDCMETIKKNMIGNFKKKCEFDELKNIKICKPKIILGQIDDEYQEGSAIYEYFYDKGNVQFLFLRGAGIIFEADGYINNQGINFIDYKGEKRKVIFKRKISYHAEDYTPEKTITIYNYEGEKKSCFDLKIFKNEERQRNFIAYDLLDKRGITEICGYEPRLRLDIDTLQDDEYGLLKSLVENFNLDNPLDICFDGGVYNYDTYTNSLYICTLRANTSLLSEISDEFLEFYNNYNDFGDTYNEKKYIELCKLNNGGVGIFYDSKDECQIP